MINITNLLGVSTIMYKLINLSKHRRWTIEGIVEAGKDGRNKSKDQRTCTAGNAGSA